MHGIDYSRAGVGTSAETLQLTQARKCWPRDIHSNAKEGNIPCLTHRPGKGNECSRVPDSALELLNTLATW